MLTPHRIRRALLTAAALSLACSACGRTGATRGDVRAEAEAALRRPVHSVLRVPGSGVLAVLEREQVAGAEETRWLALLDAHGRTLGRAHTYLPVADAPGRFGSGDWDGDGRPEVYAIGSAGWATAWAIEVVVLTPGGAVSRYEVNAGLPPGPMSAVWTPELDEHPERLAWIAALAHRAFPAVARDASGNWPDPGRVTAGVTLSRAQAIEAARQRLGWGVRDAFPLPPGSNGDSRVAALVAQRTGSTEAHVVLLGGRDHIFREDVLTRSLLSGTVRERPGRFGVVDVENDGHPEVFLVINGDGSRVWEVVIDLLDPDTGDVSEIYAAGDQDDPRTRLELRFSPNLANRPRARAWLQARADSVIRTAD